MNGGHSTFSTFGSRGSFALITETSSWASATVLFIFQFPATSGVRMTKFLFEFGLICRFILHDNTSP